MNVARRCIFGSSVLVALLAGACGSDGNEEAGGGGASTGGAGSGGTGTGGTTHDGGGLGGAGGAADASGGQAGSDAGCVAAEVTLKNDAFVNNSQVAFEAGFAAGECWASSFVPEACTFDVKSALVLFGGGDGGSVDLEVSVWGVDATGKPETQLGSMTTTLSGSSDALGEVALSALGLPPLDGKNFAIAVCQSHAGFPSIARDGDGITKGRNWIFTQQQWVDASTLGVAGDWILRAKVKNH